MYGKRASTHRAAAPPHGLTTRRASLYQPFAWVVWGWRYSTSRDAGIRRPLFEGEMIVVAGSLQNAGERIDTVHDGNPIDNVEHTIVHTAHVKRPSFSVTMPGVVATICCNW